jgi:NAD-dependent SIR2 family protein deacetylase
MRAGEATLARLERFLTRHPRLFVITGAGVSTASGIPDYRDGDGAWKRAEPIRFQDFIASDSARRRYWARSLIGWPGFAAARPNRAHHGIARLEALGHIEQLVTQNVDRLHQAAGNRRAIDLHGRLDRVECLDCGHRMPRQTFQQELALMNPALLDLDAASAPDGDALLEGVDFETFHVPACARCGGPLKPAVVFFGETVPKARVALAYAFLGRADAVLVIGSSLMVYSGFRFCRAAAEQGKPIAAINRGHTRADPLLQLKVDAECGATLGALLERLGSNPDFSPGGPERHEMGCLKKGWN